MDNQNIGDPYQIFVAEDNSSVYVRLLPNDVIRTDDDFPYTFYRYPANGNPGTLGSGGGNTIMSSPTESTTETTPATSYGYALDGRRIGKAGHVNMKYLYDGENVVYELWDHMTVRFTHPVVSGGGGGSGACGAGSCDIFFTDHPISITIIDEYGVATKYYYLYDGLGSVTELIDVNENVVNFYRYTPFGDALIREETVYNPYQFTGRQYDAESGLYHYRARAYSADIGRFMQQDPAGMVDGANMYAYVGNNPVNGVDPSGMKIYKLWIPCGFGSWARVKWWHFDTDRVWNDLYYALAGMVTTQSINKCIAGLAICAYMLYLLVFGPAAVLSVIACLLSFCLPVIFRLAISLAKGLVCKV